MIPVTGWMTVTRQESLASELSTDVAFIQASPAFNAVTRPFSLTEAITSFDVVQITFLSSALSGETLTSICPFSPTFNDMECLSTETPETCCSTFTTQVAVCPPSIVVTVTNAVPTPVAVTSPELDTVQTCLFELSHLTDLSVASSGVITAPNCLVSPISAREICDSSNEISVTFFLIILNSATL